jgi:hypothetical protein
MQRRACRKEVASRPGQGVPKHARMRCLKGGPPSGGGGGRSRVPQQSFNHSLPPLLLQPPPQVERGRIEQARETLVRIRGTEGEGRVTAG